MMTYKNEDLNSFRSIVLSEHSTAVTWKLKLLKDE